MNVYSHSLSGITKNELILPVHCMEGDTSELVYQFNITAGAVSTIIPQTSVSGLKDTWVDEAPLTINPGTGSILYTADGATKANYIRFKVLDAVDATILVQGREQDGGGSGSGGGGEVFRQGGLYTINTYDATGPGVTTSGARAVSISVIGTNPGVIDGVTFDPSVDPVIGINKNLDNLGTGYDSIAYDATGTIIRVTETLLI